VSKRVSERAGKSERAVGRARRAGRAGWKENELWGERNKRVSGVEGGELWI
jgi:hypothetical protein